MSGTTKIPVNRCSACQTETQLQWHVCPNCGLRLKPIKALVRFWLFWILAFLAFAGTEGVLIFRALFQAPEHPEGFGFAIASVFMIVIGWPMVVIFAESLLLRVNRQPLIDSHSSHRAVGMTLLYLVVFPIAIGFSVLILSFATCVSSVNRINSSSAELREVPQ
jgi:hypothetical protein